MFDLSMHLDIVYSFETSGWTGRMRMKMTPTVAFKLFTDKHVGGHN